MSKNFASKKIAAIAIATCLALGTVPSLSGCSGQAEKGDATGTYMPTEQLLGGRFTLIDSFDDGGKSTGMYTAWDSYVYEDVTTGNVYMLVIGSSGYRGFGRDLVPLYDADGQIMSADKYWGTKDMVDMGE